MIPPRDYATQLVGFVAIAVLIIVANVVGHKDYPNPAETAGAYVVERSAGTVREYLYWPVTGSGMRFVIDDRGSWTPKLGDAWRFVDRYAASAIAMRYDGNAVRLEEAQP